MWVHIVGCATTRVIPSPQGTKSERSLVPLGSASSAAMPRSPAPCQALVRSWGPHDEQDELGLPHGKPVFSRHMRLLYAVLMVSKEGVDIAVHELREFLHTDDRMGLQETAERGE